MKKTLLTAISMLAVASASQAAMIINLEDAGDGDTVNFDFSSDLGSTTDGSFSGSAVLSFTGAFSPGVLITTNDISFTGSYSLTNVTEGVVYQNNNSSAPIGFGTSAPGTQTLTITFDDDLVFSEGDEYIFTGSGSFTFNTALPNQATTIVENTIVSDSSGAFSGVAGTDVTPVPEPSAAVLVALGGFGLAIRRRR
ncbi:PEP-CTERM sorting domain-containing protein [Persicirhabdus sediminis]|uniref:PEP-CTERM sorting domain-containing protein n=1 Tax=Persicirhabdus sediminis TaxID=454144 RepID=A0A8J7MC16_9BACT|nr:PEP-CTERM sorting domain-containing protein [Persicirhabdus sediminis]MBK1790298.1 PEP-CTERM sorting domain-containing protein [Persicirhabdus sediminis]